jgi:hypothetical protein
LNFSKLLIYRSVKINYFVEIEVKRLLLDFHLLRKQSGLGTEGLYGLSNYGKIDGGWTRFKI